jgi:Response regulator containing CheY-like receiver domain and AraC-type DNA-binding domain
MIVEDEDIIRIGLRDKIPWENMGFTIAGEADNGKSAIELIPLLHPDVILSDIRMSGMDGISLISKLKESNPEIEAVVLSGYDDFEYARKCIEFGVVEYLLKPVNNENIIRTFSKLRSKLDSRNAMNLEYDNIRKKTEMTVPIAREKMIRDLLDNKLDRTDLNDVYSILDYPYSESISFCIALFHISIDEKSIVKIEDINKDIKTIIHNTMSMFPSFDLLEIILIKEFNTTALVLCNKDTGSEGLVVDLCLEIKRNIENYIIRTDSVVVVISAGVGLFYQNIYELNLSYVQAKAALEKKFFLGKGRIIHYREISEVFNGSKRLEQKSSGIEESKLVCRINDAVLSSDIDAIENNIILYFDMFADWTVNTTDMIFMKVIEMILNLSVRLGEKGIEFNDVNNMEIDYTVKNLLLNGTREELKNRILEFYRDISRNINALEDRHSTDLIIENAKNYIHQNYDKKVSRKELSDFVFTSQSYFFNLFKKKTGQSFIEYITMVRINKAKELLTRSEYKVYEVAEMVGYDDFRHFSKVFKKMENISPTEYREYNLARLSNPDDYGSQNR